MSDRPSAGTDHPAADIHDEARELSGGEDVLLNDRTVPLTVTGKHDRPNRSRTRIDLYHVIELAGNGTEYHLLCYKDAAHGPMLYKKSEWETVEDDPQVNYEYPRGGERVTDFQVATQNTNQEAER